MLATPLAEHKEKVNYMSYGAVDVDMEYSYTVWDNIETLTQ